MTVLFISAAPDGTPPPLSHQAEGVRAPTHVDTPHAPGVQTSFAMHVDPLKYNRGCTRCTLFTFQSTQPKFISLKSKASCSGLLPLENIPEPNSNPAIAPAAAERSRGRERERERDKERQEKEQRKRINIKEKGETKTTRHLQQKNKNKKTTLSFLSLLSTLH